jgi:hypothetical protein
MPSKTRKTNNRDCAGPRGENPLKLAVRLVLNQLSQGIGFAEAVQFAAKYHNVKCAAIYAQLSKKRVKLLNQATD